MAEESPLLNLDTNALSALRLLAEQRLPALLVTNPDGSPHSILPASQVVRFLVPGYVQDDPSLARVMNESMADRAADQLGSKRVRDLLPTERRALPFGGSDEGQEADWRDQRIPTAGAGPAAQLTHPGSPARDAP